MYISSTARHKMSSSSLWCQNFKSPHHIARTLNTGPGSASKVFMMSQISLVRPRPLKSGSQRSMWKTAVMCKTLHGHHSTQWGSNIQLQEQEEEKKKTFWLKGAFKCFCAIFAFLTVGIWIIIWQEMKREMLNLWPFRVKFNKLT